MKFVLCSGVTAAGIMALGIAAFAQEAQPPSQPQQKPAAAAPAQGQQTFTGCVQAEADYRRARDAGKGGVAGTGVGAGNEFVLINASMGSGAGAAPAGTAGAEGAKPTGTGGAVAGSAYELTGSGEGQVKQHVGKRVEITGMLKAAEVGASGPTGGPTAGAPPRGVDVTSSDLQLREIEVASVREVAGACPAADSK